MLRSFLDRQEPWWRVARILVGALLLAAAWGKGHKLATDSTWGNNLWDSRWFLVSLVLVEIALGLWLLFGLYPKWSWLAAISSFVVLGLFNVFLTVKGERVCPCFGELALDPKYVAFLDLLIALAIALCPLTNPEEPSFSSAPWRLYSFALVSALVFVPALLNMVYYTNRGLALDLRSDSRLQTALQRELRNPESEAIVGLLTESTGLIVTLDERLRNKPPDYGFWRTGKAWSVMIGMAEKQVIPARWEKNASGYHLAAAAPWGNATVPWFLSLGTFAAYCVYLGYLACTRGQAKLLKSFGC